MIICENSLLVLLLLDIKKIKICLPVTIAIELIFSSDFLFLMYVLKFLFVCIKIEHKKILLKA